MPLVIVGTGTDTRPEFTGETLPSSARVPSKREAISALGILERMVKTQTKAVLQDNEVLTWDQAFSTLRRYVLTR